MKRYLFLVAGLVCISLVAQNLANKVSNESFQNSNPTEGPPMRAYKIKMDYDGSNNLIYMGWAAALNRQADFEVDTGSLVNFVDSGSTGTINFGVPHCLEVGEQIVVSGATSDLDVNATYKVLTVTDSDTITVTSANVTDATYNNDALKLTTTVARTCDTVWSIQKNTYDGSNNMTKRTWAQQSSQGFTLAWDSRTTYAY